VGSGQFAPLAAGHCPLITERYFVDLDSLRAYCLSFPGATEGLQWGDDLLFRVGNKIFVTVALGGVPQCMTVKSTPERCAELLEIEGISRAPYVGRYDWVMLERLDLLRDAEMRELIAESYQNVRNKLPRRVQAGIEGMKQPTLRRAKAATKKKKTRKSPGRK
jgi:predicted DNA-binding protein (MmcQ/YjbR family)